MKELPTIVDAQLSQARRAVGRKVVILLSNGEGFTMSYGSKKEANSMVKNCIGSRVGYGYRINLDNEIEIFHDPDSQLTKLEALECCRLEAAEQLQKAKNDLSRVEAKIKEFRAEKRLKWEKFLNNPKKDF